MSEDPRCCGSGTCIIDDEGRCWCGQQWNGQQMCFPVAVAERPVERLAQSAAPEPGLEPEADPPQRR